MKEKLSIYLDNNASAFLDPRIALAIQKCLNTPYGNPSSVHSYGQEARGLLNQARRNVASFLNIKPQELVFTSNGSEAMNFLIRGVLSKKEKGHIITSNVEHVCVQKTLQIFENNGFSITYLETGKSGHIDVEQLKQSIQPDTELIVLMAANNETGVKNDIEAIASLAHAASIPLLVDAVALFGKESLTIPIGVSGMAFSGHKIHALQGVGAAFARTHLKLPPLIVGGSQEYGYRGGTENLLGIFSFSEAVTLLRDEPASFSRIARLRDKLEKTLLEVLPDVKVNGTGPRIGNTSNLCFNGVDGESLLIALDQEGICVSHGSACSSGARQPSAVLLNMGFPLNEVRSSIRISLSRMTQESEIDHCIEALVKIVPRLRG